MVSTLTIVIVLISILALIGILYFLFKRYRPFNFEAYSRETDRIIAKAENKARPLVEKAKESDERLKQMIREVNKANREAFVKDYKIRKILQSDYKGRRPA